jgi:hypothetical protein
MKSFILLLGILAVYFRMLNIFSGGYLSLVRTLSLEQVAEELVVAHLTDDTFLRGGYTLRIRAMQRCTLHKTM